MIRYRSPEGERQEEKSWTFVELWLELYPVESESVEEGWESLHQTEDAHRQHRPEPEDDI